MEIIQTSVDPTTETFTPVERPDYGRPLAELDLEDFYFILQMHPNDSWVAIELARRLQALGRQAEALTVWRNVVKIDSRFETVLALALAEYEMGFDSEAFNHLQEALLIADGERPELFDLFKTLGNIFVRRGDLESAEDSYNKAHRLAPESDVLQVNYGTLAVQRQDWDRAIGHFRQAIGLNSNNDRAWVGLAIGHRMKGDFELAWGNLDTALEISPLNEAALTLSLDWSVHDGLEFKTLEHIRKFLLAGGWNERFSLAFAWLSWRRNERAVAALELERVLSVNPKNEHAETLMREMRLRV